MRHLQDGDTASSVLAEFFGILDGLDTAVKAVYLDRGFYDSKCLTLLQAHNYAYVVPIIQWGETIAAGLTDSGEAVRINAPKALNRAGRADPNAIAAQRSQLIAALNDSNATVRANAYTLIGNANISVPTERLRELRENDSNERVRSQAAYALSRQQS